MNKFRWILLSVILLCVVAVIVMAFRTQIQEIAYIVPERRDIRQRLFVSGTIQPRQEIELKSPISGVLETLYVQVGDLVELGQPIARVQFVKDPLEYKALLNRLEVERAQYEKEKKHFDRIDHLYKLELVSDEEYETDRAAFLVAESELDAVRSEVEMIQGKYLQKGVTNIVKATSAGTILQLPVKEGGSVMARGTWNEGSTLAQIADMDELVFRGYVLETDVMAVCRDMPIALKVSTCPDVHLDGKVILIAPKAMEVQGKMRYEIVASVQVTDSVRPYLLAGCSAVAELITGEALNVWSVEEQYLQYAEDSVYVELVEEKGNVTRRPVRIGLSDGMCTQLLDEADSLLKIKK